MAKLAPELRRLLDGGKVHPPRPQVGPDGSVGPPTLLMNPNRFSTQTPLAELSESERLGTGGLGRELASSFMGRGMALLSSEYERVVLAKRRVADDRRSYSCAHFVPYRTFCSRCKECRGEVEGVLNAEEIMRDVGGTPLADLAEAAAHGFPMRFEGERQSFKAGRDDSPRNWPVSEGQEGALVANVLKAKRRGVLRLFSSPEECATAANRFCSHRVAHLMVGKLGVVRKTDDEGNPIESDDLTKKFRPIHHNDQVNNGDGLTDATGIPRGQPCVLDRIPDMVGRTRYLIRKYASRFGRERVRVVAYRADMENAFGHMHIHPCSLYLMACSVVIEGTRYWTLNEKSSFGIRQSMYAMTRLGEGLRWVMRKVYGASFDLYVDDAFGQGVLVLHDGTWTESGVDVEDRISFNWYAVNRLVKRWSIAWADQKLVFGDALVYLGVVADLNLNELRLTSGRRERIVTTLTSWLSDQWVLRHDFDSCIGLLGWVCQTVMPPLRVYLNYLYVALRRMKHRGAERTRLSAESSKTETAVRLILAFICDWSGRHIYLTAKQVTADRVDFYSDASKDAGAVYFNGRYMIWRWTAQQKANHHIAELEFVAGLVGLAMYGRSMEGLCVQGSIDSENVADIQAKFGTTQSETLMFYTAQARHLELQGRFHFAWTWISTHVNVMTDDMTRLEGGTHASRTKAKRSLDECFSRLGFTPIRDYISPTVIQNLLLRARGQSVPE